MKTIVGVGVAAVVASALSQPASGGDTRFGVTQIVIADTTNVNAVAINNKRAIVGTYTIDSVMHGFVTGNGVLTTLPPTYAGCLDRCVAIPTAINTDGVVAGQTFSGTGYAFLWKDNAYVGAGGFTLGLGLGVGSVAGPGLNDKGQVFYNEHTGSGLLTPHFGSPGAAVPIIPPGSFPQITSINNNGAVAGTFAPYLRSIFFEKNGNFVTILPPGALESQGGFINDVDEVAGSYRDAASVWHGLLYFQGEYARFDMPMDAASITVQAINNRGRVIGFYVDGKNKLQHAFLFNGITVSDFGEFASEDRLHFAMNDIGVMLISDYAVVQYQSWRVLCGGAGC
jgi:probable HAF family extracellular repeat protein